MRTRTRARMTSSTPWKANSARPGSPARPASARSGSAARDHRPRSMKNEPVSIQDIDQAAHQRRWRRRLPCTRTAQSRRETPRIRIHWHLHARPIAPIDRDARSLSQPSHNHFYNDQCSVRSCSLLKYTCRFLPTARGPDDPRAGFFTRRVSSRHSVEAEIVRPQINLSSVLVQNEASVRKIDRSISVERGAPL